MAVVLGLVMCVACHRSDPTRERIIRSVERQLERYPHSTLRDLYKNYFQDRFGPGHIIADEQAADRYLRYETTWFAMGLLLERIKERMQ